MVSAAGPHASSCAGSRSALTARPSSPRRTLVRQGSEEPGTALMDGFAADKTKAEGHRAAVFPAFHRVAERPVWWLACLRNGQGGRSSGESRLVSLLGRPRCRTVFRRAPGPRCRSYSDHCICLQTWHLGGVPLGAERGPTCLPILSANSTFCCRFGVGSWFGAYSQPARGGLPVRYAPPRNSSATSRSAVSMACAAGERLWSR
jgi:hypothetical protein